jgi:hypothetical protein
MRAHNLAGPVSERLEGAPVKRFADAAAWRAHLAALGLTALAVTPDPVRLATEGALRGSVALDRLLARLHGRKAELLLVLDRPEIPLHTNGSENDLRGHVIKRKISGGTQSEAGRMARDAPLGLLRTCRKLGVAFFAYLGDRLGVPGAPAVAPLPDLVRARSPA